ncbi:hypothetical protein SUGI_1124830 [Cryptomeria japonica]|nr:hypothetical protein SUGI_1124830 [Cryptomeria japonica]
MKASIWKIGSALLRPTIFSTYRSFAAKAKKGGGKGGGAAAPAAPTISKEVKATTVYGANILKDGVDPPIKPDSEYPDWLWHLLDKHPPLSELQRKNPNPFLSDCGSAVSEVKDDPYAIVKMANCANDSEQSS